MTTILQLSPSIRMSNEDFRDLLALFIIDYGTEVNPIFVCKVIGTGEVKSFTSNQVTIPLNFTFESNL